MNYILSVSTVINITQEFVWTAISHESKVYQNCLPAQLISLKGFHVNNWYVITTHIGVIHISKSLLCRSKTDTMNSHIYWGISEKKTRFENKMVQLFYYENRGKCCRKVFNYEGYPTKVMLFPYEGWAHPVPVTYWTLKTYWWNRSRCKIVEVSGTKKRSTKGKMSDKGSGSMVISGKFKNTPSPDFRMTLTTNISNEDFQLGYCVTGTLERGDKKKGDLQLAQFAMVKRRGYWPHDELFSHLF